ncbi:MAG: hypothetical protein A3I89_03385 [Candidatus Harrisonbacteria bacterium RIFCSPLOWO2_02_FULL_41_11]|uniref:Uncharacterized protein n=1 Tax=Candidatus Harrisonbacteria bacterium RIFCSPHIGHO2_02_FULL_42_16 TaxID=1798404 RepID=A0A1G1ZIK1_9BACT|nr:MAG: hypothetical protein A3B92_02985 [Candidatus Harrisonbacteria bacterium RIFCSPHIGHO2_02_FULL_42_16]OGY67227.1 MAG: hypothetical protein A3I89_03385 [Candidatus Harrisonbacteria bacterium RIFCSPLOWO2_02_FULL_41_11]
MSKQAILEKIEQRIKVVGGRQPAVTLSLQDWQLVEDMILELSSSKLLKSIEKSRKDYENKKGIVYQPKVF